MSWVILLRHAPRKERQGYGEGWLCMTKACFAVWKEKIETGKESPGHVGNLWSRKPDTWHLFKTRRKAMSIRRLFGKPPLVSDRKKIVKVVSVEQAKALMAEEIFSGAVETP